MKLYIKWNNTVYLHYIISSKINIHHIVSLILSYIHQHYLINWRSNQWWLLFQCAICYILCYFNYWLTIWSFSYTIWFIFTEKNSFISGLVSPLLCLVLDTITHTHCDNSYYYIVLTFIYQWYYNNKEASISTSKIIILLKIQVIITSLCNRYKEI